jgi:hypothetical protein
MQTVVDVDEKIVTMAKLKAARQGRTFDSIVEEGLRLALDISSSIPQKPASDREQLDEEEAFFSALKEIRELGKASIAGRAVGVGH